VACYTDESDKDPAQVEAEILEEFDRVSLEEWRKVVAEVMGPDYDPDEIGF
jgi:hypothetical protein